MGVAALRASLFSTQHSFFSKTSKPKRIIWLMLPQIGTFLSTILAFQYAQMALLYKPYTSPDKTYTLRVKDYTLRHKDYTSRDKTYVLRGESTISREETYVLRRESTISRDKTYVLPREVYVLSGEVYSLRFSPIKLPFPVSIFINKKDYQERYLLVS